MIRHLLRAGLCVAAVTLAAEPLLAQLGVNCTISTGSVNFGAYDVFNAAPTDSTGSVTVQCTAGVLVRIDLGRGSSPTFAPRTMRAGSEALDYNLYLDATHTTVWGDGTGGTSSASTIINVLFPSTQVIYGRIPARQDVTAGSYTDTVTAVDVF